MGVFWHRLLDELRGLTAGLRTLRAPLIAAIVSYFLLSAPAQIQEIYLVLILDSTARWLQVVLGLLGLLSLSVLLWTIAANLARTRPASGDTSAITQTEKWVRRIGPILVGVLPLLAAARGLTRNYDAAQLRNLLEISDVLRQLGTRPEFAEIIAKMPPEIADAIRQSDPVLRAIRSGAAFLGALAALLVLSFALPRSKTLGRLRRAILTASPGVRKSLLWVGLGCIVLFGMQTANAGNALPFDFTALPRALGPLAILTVFLACFTVILSTLSSAYDRYGIPVSLLLLIIAIVASYFDFNDNHGIRILRQTVKTSESSPERGGSSVLSLKEAFTKWFEAIPSDRREMFLKAGKPYPVFVVAAEGGGIYAANLAGVALARLYDRCPAIRYHLFAVSSVSGGSLGAALIASLLRHKEESSKSAGEIANSGKCDLDLQHGEVGWLERTTSQFLAEDFLSPVGAAGLFPDLVQRFIPWPPIPVFDRARAFEASMEETWSRTVGGRNLMRESFLDHWSPTGPAPMLFLNTTSVQTGGQVVIAPVIAQMHLKTGVGPRSIFFDALDSQTDDLPMSTAIGMSSRFPLVLPAALIDNGRRGPAKRFADGGYFENSGIETGNNIIDALLTSEIYGGRPGPLLITREGANADSTEHNHVALSLISLSEAEPQRPDLGGEGLGETMSPIRALFRARVQRGTLALERASRGSYHTVLINREYFNLPLGWQLAARTQQSIAAQIGVPSQCLGGETELALLDAAMHSKRQGDDNIVAALDDQFLNGLYDNACTLCRTLRIVKGEDGLNDRDDQCAAPVAAPAATRSN